MTQHHLALRRTTRAGALVTALLTAVLAASLAGCGSDSDESSTESSAQSSAQSSGEPSTGSASTDQPAITLHLPEGAAGRCMAPNVRVLRSQEVAFEGTASEVAEGRVVLEVSRWFRGDETATAVVEAPAEGMVELGFGTDFEEGRTYLVSATDGEVTLCGFTGERTGQLARLFERAYGG